MSTTTVLTSARPAGISRSVEVSRSPKTVIATDRGIGVAVITSTWGRRSALALSAARCSTPNRCCSSTTTRPRSANWTSALSKAWVPMTIPAVPEAAWSVASRRRAAGGRPGDQDDARGVLGRAESATAGQFAEHAGDGLVMLSGQHLGWCQQRGLAAGVDHCQHRSQRDHGLAGADLALQQSLHRLGAAQLGHDLLAHCDLTLGEHERQAIVEGVEQPAGPSAVSAHCSVRGCVRPPIRHRQLQSERLVEPHPVTALVDD